MNAKIHRQNWLSNLTILDLSSLLPCPFAAHLLAKMGAKVIKVESPNRPDPARAFGFVPEGKTGSCYRAINEIKELVLLDLKDPKDRNTLYEMVKTADGVIEGYRPEVRQRLGIEYQTLAALNQSLVYCSVSGFDPSGPMRDRAGHDINFVARSGILDQTRDGDGKCILPGLPIGDYIVAQAAALRMAAALFGAAQTKKGCHIELSIEESLLEVQEPFLFEAQESGHPPKAGESLVTGKYPCYGLYAVGTGTFALGALEEKFWVKFCKTIEEPGLTLLQFATGAKCLEVRKIVEKRLQKRSFEEWQSIFSKVDCCIEPVLSVQEVISNH